MGGIIGRIGPLEVGVYRSMAGGDLRITGEWYFLEIKNCG